MVQNLLVVCSRATKIAETFEIGIVRSELSDFA